MRSIKRSTLVTASTWAIAWASPVSAQEAVVVRQLDDLVAQAAAQGIEPFYRQLGALNQGQRASFEFWVSAEAAYAIAGACDNDCSDLDLGLEASWLIDADTNPDDHPEMTNILHPNITYTVHVTMANCRVAPCNWGVQILHDPR
jgi:hypothetical protein